jgi:hypothetical protein
MPRYKFVCRSCKFECISGIGREVGLHASKMAMVCEACLMIDTYSVAHSEYINAEIKMPPVCTSCHSSRHLSEWDGLTCPHCKMNMRAFGGDVDAERPFKYW